MNNNCEESSWYLGRIGKEVSLFICTSCYEYIPVVNESLYMPSKNVSSLFPTCPNCHKSMIEEPYPKIDENYSFKSMKLIKK